MGNMNIFDVISDSLQRLNCSMPPLASIEGDYPNETVTVFTNSHGQCEVKDLGKSSEGRVAFSTTGGRIRPVAVGVLVCGSVLFSNADYVIGQMVERTLRTAGERLILNVDRGDSAFPDLALRTGAIYVAGKIGMLGSPVDEIVQTIASVYSAAAAATIDLIRSRMDAGFCRSADVLAKCPENEVNQGTLTFYMGLDATAADRPAVAERRIRTASPFPVLAGYISSVPRIAEAVDGNEKLFRVVDEATDGAITKPIMTRLGQARDPRARLAVASGMLKDLPPDQYPRSDEHWKCALDLWDASCMLADAVDLPILSVWKASRIVHAKGDWEALTKNVLNRGLDTRPPFDLGLTKDDASEVEAGLDLKPFGASDDIYDKISTFLSKAEQILNRISERDGRDALAEFNKERFSEWMLRTCYRRVSARSLFASLRGVAEASSLFGQRVLLPNVLVAERLTGLPIVTEIVGAATSSAFEVLTSEMTFPNLATLSRNFIARSTLLSAAILSSRERQVEADPTPDAPAAREVIKVDDSVWRQAFNIVEDTADWPTITPIMEMMPGIVFVPIDNMLQAREEGTLTPGKLDRNGVPEMNHCLGVIHAPVALTENGKYQLFSIREVKNGSYKRLASGAFKMDYNKQTDGLTIRPPGSHHFNGPSNVPPPPIAKQAFEMYCDYVRTTPAALNPKVIEEVKNQGDQKVQFRTEPVRRDITLPKLIGYNPFQVYKLEAAWENWRLAGLISPDWLEKSLEERARVPQVDHIHEAVRDVLRRIGVDPGVQAVDPETGASKPIPATSSRKGMAGIFM